MTNKEKAIAFVEAYFDESKTIVVKDEMHGIKTWTSIRDENCWTYLDMFIRNIDCYRLINNRYE